MKNTASLQTLSIASRLKCESIRNTLEVNSVVSKSLPLCPWRSPVDVRRIGKGNPVKATERFRMMGVTLVWAGLGLVGLLGGSARGRVQDQGDGSDSRIEQGFEIAPVHLNMDGLNPALVGLGSYIVNTEGCNDCHSAGPPTQYARGGNPFFGQPKKVNPATYLGGGRDFLTTSGPPSPHIISRNLTPSTKTGLPEGDHSFEEFLTIIRTGKDFDHLHPNCSVTVTTNCYPQNLPNPPVDGDLLQVMPWPNFKDLTDHEIRAIYEYLKAVPCIQGNYPGPNGAAAGIPAEPSDRCGQ
jgi:hypothetical protein